MGMNKGPPLITVTVRNGLSLSFTLELGYLAFRLNYWIPAKLWAKSKLYFLEMVKVVTLECLELTKEMIK